MLKFLFPVLFLSTNVFAQEIPKELQGPEIHSTVEGLYLPPAPPSGKCATNFEEMKAALHANGFEALFVAHDKYNATISREVMYNPSYDELAFVSMQRDSENDNADSKITKICVDYMMKDPYVVGEGLKKFIIHQIIDDDNASLKAQTEAQKEHSEKEKEPFQGDPNKVHYTPLTNN